MPHSPEPRYRPRRGFRHALFGIAALAGAASGNAQLPFPLPQLPFPLPSLPSSPGGSGLPSVPFIAPPMAAVPADSAQHRSILAEYGPAMTVPQAALVQHAMAAISEITRPVSPPGGFRVTLVDSTQVNAFAIAEGNTYVTRQLLALMNSEEELIGVMGHEAGHAMARHLTFSGVVRTAQKRGTSLLALVAPDIAENAAFASTLVLRVFDRAQEHQSDVTGVKVLADLGLDPMGMARAINLLEANSSLDMAIYGAPKPDVWSYWMRDHPVSAERLALIELSARMAPRAAPRIQTDQAAFIRSLDGLMFDTAPREGIVNGRSLRIPPIRLAMEAPEGFSFMIGDGTVVAMGPDKARGVLKPQAGTGTLAQAFAAAWADEFSKDKTVPDPKTGTINGIDTAYVSGRIDKESGFVDYTLAVMQWPAGGFVRVLLVDPNGAAAEPLGRLVGSIRLMTPQEAAEVKVRRIKVVQPGPGDTVASLARRMAYDDRQEMRFRALNGIAANAGLPQGRPVKLVVWSS